MGDIDMEECALSNMETMTQSVPVQRQIEESIFTILRPTIQTDSTIEFNVREDEYYIELNKTEVDVKFRITKDDGSNLAAGDHVGTINYPGATLFQNVEIVLNDTIITQGSNNYAERAIMEVLMSYSKEACDGWLRGALFEKDTAGKMDVADPNAADDAVNKGLKTRAEYSKTSNLVTVRSKLHEDFFNQSRPLPSGNKLHIKFTRHQDPYCLMSAVGGATYKVVIQDMVLHIFKIRVSNNVKLNQVGKSIIFPIDRVEQKSFNVQKEGTMVMVDTLHDGQIPTRLVFGFVDIEAHTGKYSLNPFNWVHGDIRKVTLSRDGQMVNAGPLEVNFTTGNVMDGFWSLYRATNIRYSNAGMLIDMDDYKKGGYNLWAFDLSPSQCDEQFNDPKRRGKLSLQVEFAQARAKPLALCVYLQFNSEIIINKEGKVLKMYD